MAGITGLDHVLIGVGDLAAAAEGWQRLGFTLTPRGRHIGWGTGNYCIMFPGDYLELLGVVDDSQPLNGLDTLLAEREGLLGLAFAAAGGLDQAAAALAEAGIAGEPPKPLSRLLELPEGTVEPAFRTLHPAAPESFGVRGFVCEHLTPALIRRPAWLEHPNGARRVRAVTIAAPSPLALFQRWRSLAGPTAVVAGGAGLTVRLGTALCHFGQDDALQGPIGLAIEVADLDRAAAALDQGGVGYQREGGEIAVDLAACNGVVLTFQAGGAG